jgi:signal transduction histidine kinase
MSKGSGLVLQPRQKLHQLSQVNLLIVTEGNTDIARIVATLKAAGLNFFYEVTSAGESSFYLSERVYDAILYNYYLSDNHQTTASPLDQLDWWYDLAPNIPLILITDVLGDELAIECIRSGISGYVLRNNLVKLPDALKNSLISSTQKQTKQLTQIQQQQKYIQQLEQEKLSWQAAEAAKQELLSHLHHELRNPIAAIIGFAGMLKDEIYGSLNPRQMQYICAIASSGEHLLDLVNDYLDLAKIDAQQETLYPEKLAVEEICRASLAMVQEKARTKGLELILKLDKQIDFCVADKLRLKQILVNLLSNAVKFTEVGSVTLQVESLSQMLTFAVIDTGIGISPDDQQKLFQPFQQIKTSINRRDKGTGLGLALSRKLARLHGGDLKLTSTVGKGSCFTLYIPRTLKEQVE